MSKQWLASHLFCSESERWGDFVCECRYSLAGGGIMGILDESEDHRKTVHWKRNSPSGNNPAHIYTSAIPPAAITYPQGAFSHAVILSILLSQSRDPV